MSAALRMKAVFIGDDIHFYMERAAAHNLSFPRTRESYVAAAFRVRQAECPN